MATEKTRTDTLRIGVSDQFTPRNALAVEELLRSVSRYYGGSDWRLVENSHRGGFVEIARDVDYIDVTEDMELWVEQTYTKLRTTEPLLPLYIAAVYHSLADFTHMRMWSYHIEAAAGTEQLSQSHRAALLGQLVEALTQLLKNPEQNPAKDLDQMRRRLFEDQSMRQGSVVLNNALHSAGHTAFVPVPAHMAPTALDLLPEPEIMTHFVQAQMERSTKDAYDTVWLRDSAQWWASGFGRAFHKLGDLLEDRYLGEH